ncbi:hypothetical protein HDV04_001243 [Boothiomyces sp. JEL0838]|nr:hypothetical protein HDV04_001243 [Boothiomyces sp. JEL0838]
MVSAALLAFSTVSATTIPRQRGVHYRTDIVTAPLLEKRATAALKYYGGPVIPNVEVHPIFYGGDSVQYKSQINQFYAGVVNSPYYDWLSEYNTPNQTIGRGTFGGSIDYTTNLKTSLDDQNDIQPLLVGLADAGTISPNANTYFPIHFKPSIDITQGGSASCQVFCAYHGTISYKGGYIYYGVVPDQGGSCAGGCGSSFNRLSNLQSVTSHELIEATTDPAVGLATGNAAPLSWYDSNNGEIGDICNGKQGTITGGDGKTYTVQKEWSNKKNSCIVKY